MSLAQQVRDWVGDRDPHTLSGTSFPGRTFANRGAVNSALAKLRVAWDRERIKSAPAYTAAPYVSTATALAHERVERYVAAGDTPAGAINRVRQEFPGALA
jgi:hypothetical protein